MSTASNARSSQVMSNVASGRYISNNKFRNYDPSSEVDRPSWDCRPVKTQKWADDNLKRIRKQKKLLDK